MFNIKVVKELPDYSNNSNIVSRMSQLVNIEFSKRNYPYIAYNSKNTLHVMEIKTEVSLKNTNMFTSISDQIEYGVEESRLLKQVSTEDVLEKNIRANNPFPEPKLTNLQSEQDRIKEINQAKVEEITPIIKQALSHTIKNINRKGSIIMNPNSM
jgi:hypothetical protein